MATKTEELKIKVVLDGDAAEAVVANLERRIDALAAKLRGAGVSGAGAAMPVGARVVSPVASLAGAVPLALGAGIGTALGTRALAAAIPQMPALPDFAGHFGALSKQLQQGINVTQHNLLSSVDALHRAMSRSQPQNAAGAAKGQLELFPGSSTLPGAFGPAQPVPAQPGSARPAPAQPVPANPVRDAAKPRPATGPAARAAAEAAGMDFGGPATPEPVDPADLVDDPTRPKKSRKGQRGFAIIPGAFGGKKKRGPENNYGYPADDVIRQSDTGEWARYDSAKREWTTIDDPTVTPTIYSRARAYMTPERLRKAGVLAGIGIAAYAGVEHQIDRNFDLGRDPQWYDYAGIALGTAGAVGGLFLGGPLASAAAGVGGAAFGDALVGPLRRQERMQTAVAPMAATSGMDIQRLLRETQGLGIGHAEGAANLAGKLAYSLGSDASSTALGIAKDLKHGSASGMEEPPDPNSFGFGWRGRTRWWQYLLPPDMPTQADIDRRAEWERGGPKDPTKSKALSKAELDALGRAIGPGSGMALAPDAPYDPGVARQLATQDPLAAAAYIKHKNGQENADDIARLAGDATRAEKRVTTASFAPLGAEAHTRAVAARGGDASAIAGAMDVQKARLTDVADEIKAAMKALQELGDTSEDGKAKLQAYKAQLAQTSAQIAEITYAQARLRSDEALDIAGTGTAVASSRTQGRVMAARRGQDVYSDLISSLRSERATITDELDREGLKPEDYRRLKRDLAAQDAAIIQARRASADFLGGQDSRFAAIDMTRAGLVLGLSEAAGTGQEVLFGRSKIADFAERSVTAESKRLAQMNRQKDLYSDEDRSRQELAVHQAKLAARQARIASGRLPVTPEWQADMGALDMGLQETLRGHGSLAAIPNLEKTRQALRNRGVEIDQAADAAIAKTKDRAERARIDAQRDLDLQGLHRQDMGLRAAQGIYQPGPALATAYDTANTDYQILQMDPFTPGSRREASLNRLAPNLQMQGEIKRQMQGADPAAKAQLAASLNRLRVEEASIRRDETEGWLGRVLDYESGTPGHMSLMATTRKDVIRFDPRASRVFGAGDKAASDEQRNQRGSRIYGKDDSSVRPGEVGVQALKLVAEPLNVPVTLSVKQPDGSTQRQTATMRLQVQTDPRQQSLNERRR